MSSIANRCPLVHEESHFCLLNPIPLYDQRHWKFTKCPISSQMSLSVDSSHHIVPWDELDRMGISQCIPCSMPSPYSPSHPTVTRDRLERMGMSQIVSCRMLYFYCLSWDGLHGTPQIHLCYPYMYCPSHPTVLWMDWEQQVHYTGVFCGTNKLVTLPVHNHWIGIKVQWWIISWVTLCVACFLCVGITCVGVIQEVSSE